MDPVWIVALVSLDYKQVLAKDTHLKSLARALKALLYSKQFPFAWLHPVFLKEKNLSATAIMLLDVLQ